MKQPLKVCILWHMHQPDYRDPVSGQTLLPWTWLHALKDYGEMLETIAETGIRVTINLVPILLEQLERYAAGHEQDRWIELASRPPEELDGEEWQFIVKQFFSVNEETQILPNPRYHQLYRLRGQDPTATAGNFSVQDLRDLQVWFLLAWTGFHLRRNSTVVADLLQRGENFSEADKRNLLEVCRHEVARVIERHRQLENDGQIEVSITPYAHPILPLLCDLGRAREPSPELPLPKAVFRHPEDARLQIREGQQTAARILGPRPRGFWPAEGAVSPDAIELLNEEGALWAASDEGILARSLESGLKDRKQLYRVYQYHDLPLLFRDQELSDRIGFLYAGWQTDEAVLDLQSRLHKIANLEPEGTVSIILDGENCWERYSDNGYPFLRELYTMLQNDPRLQPATILEAVRASQPIPLPQLASGSWIRSDFTTWIGHPEENQAWEFLQQARDAVIGPAIDQALADPDKPLDDLTRALLRAEGSDWFWWFGDEHVTAQADIFDRLFRLHLEALYQLQGMPTPSLLHHWIKPPQKLLTGIEPGGRFTPIIDGRINDYFEWLPAGRIDLSAGGAMHASQQRLRQIYYGYDADYLYFRCDQLPLLQSLCGMDGSFEIRLLGQRLYRLCYHFDTNSLEILVDNNEIADGRGACAQVLELAVPLEDLQLVPGEQLRLSCHAFQGRHENGRWPAEGCASLWFRGASLDENNWSV